MNRFYHRLHKTRPKRRAHTCLLALLPAHTGLIHQGIKWRQGATTTSEGARRRPTFLNVAGDSARYPRAATWNLSASTRLSPNRGRTEEESLGISPPLAGTAPGAGPSSPMQMRTDVSLMGVHEELVGIPPLPSARRRRGSRRDHSASLHPGADEEPAGIPPLHPYSLRH